MSLKLRVILRFGLSLILIAAIFFLTAGTIHYWEAWVFIAIMFIPSVAFCAYYYVLDPAVLERRMQRREKVTEQKLIIRLGMLIFVVGMLMPGLDQRFGWTLRWVGGVPLRVEVLAQCLALIGYLGSMWVIDVNRFASRTIQVEQGQQVISGGPYHYVRHPMYAFALLMWMAAGPALGSLVALPIFALFVPIFVWRLLNEEKVLRQELPGYAEYCQQTRYRLLPYVW